MLDNRASALTNELLKFITSYLFSDDFNKVDRLREFRASYIHTGQDKLVAIEQILNFSKNLKGSDASALSEIYYGLELNGFITSYFNSNQWNKIVTALQIFSELRIKVRAREVYPLLNHQRSEVREITLLYLLNMSKNDPLKFFKVIERPLTLGQQIYIEDSLKHSYIGEVPDFSKWLDHKLTSVVEFSLRMMGEFNQFANIPKVERFLDHDEQNLKLTALKCLGRMEHAEIIPQMISKFKDEPLEMKKAIIDVVSAIGTYSQFASLTSDIMTSHDTLKVRFFNINRLLTSNRMDSDLISLDFGVKTVERPILGNAI